jgi:tRNA threonylcarbamoyladenosine biosynthesis protein TsaE
VSGGRTCFAADEAALRRLGVALARALEPGLVLYLQGELGAGKTTLARAIVQQLLPGARVKSPTYTLVESYATPRLVVHHLDLYRIADPEELVAIGVRDLASDGAVLLVEWPERGAGQLPAADVELVLAHAGDARQVALEARSRGGEALLARLLLPDLQAGAGNDPGSHSGDGSRNHCS